MNEDFNLKCDNLKYNIINILNESKLPIVMVYYIIKDIYHDVENSYIGYLNTVKMKEAKKVEEKIKNIEAQMSNIHDSNQED